VLKSLPVAAVAVALVAVLSPEARAATPPEGVPLEVRRGFFVETNVGAFWTMGGENTYSNAQPYLQLGVGYDLGERLSLGAHFGLGSSAANCFAGYVPGSNNQCLLADNFSVMFGDATVAYLVPLAERLYLTPKIAAGITRLDPSPKDPLKASSKTNAFNAGAGVGIEYATSMDHFSIGADLLVRYIVGPNIPTFALFPRVKYTF
jgi:hypothetical protein